MSARRLRILVLIDSLSNDGGAERVAFGLATHLPPDRFEVWFCSTRRVDPEARASLEAAGVHHVHLGRRSKWDLYRFVPLIALLRRERIDVIHAHLFGSNLWGSLIGRACGVPVVLAHEHTWDYEGGLRKLVDGRVIGRLATRFIAVSTLDADRMATMEHVPRDKIVLLPNFYMHPPQSVAGDLRSELGIEASTPLVAAVSILRRQKALHILLEAHALIVGQLPDAKLAIAGDGECREHLESRAAELGLTRSVHFLGRRLDVDSIIQAADVIAMSSDYEGTPLVALECMANRTPLVATAVGGLPDVVDNGVTGLLVEPRDPPALAGAIVELLRDPERRERMGTAAHARLPEFTIEAAVERTANLYEDLARAYTRRQTIANTGDVLILCYHALSPSWECSMAVAPGKFERQLTFLRDQGWAGATLTEAVTGRPNGKLLVITFDDAFKSVLRYAAPVMERLGFPGTVFAPTAFMDGSRRLTWPGIEHWSASPDADEMWPMDWSELRGLADKGWEIGSHTITHPHLTTLGDDDLHRELMLSREACAEHLGRPCTSIAYPYGDCDPRVLDAARAAGYTAGVRLSSDLLPGGAYGCPRVGIYRSDSWARFRLKASSAIRHFRNTRTWRQLRGAGQSTTQVVVRSS